MNFTKLQASGNDFVLVDNREKIVEGFLEKLKIDKSEFARRVCDRNRGVGADGLILIDHPRDERNHFRWEFFNSDGSVAEMCGNGSRCAVRFCYEMGMVDEEVRFETLAGVIKAWVKENGRVIRVQLTPPTQPIPKEIKFNGYEIKGFFINTGVPHFVTFVNNLEKINVEKLGREIRFHPEFKPKGTNVNFVEVIQENLIMIRTYERGVESETLACGTGATASAIVSWMEKNVSRKPVKVKTRGGDLLLIDFSDNIENVFLEGRTVRVFDGTLNIEIFM
jgi:diaminopimelate epimerase